MDTCVVTLCDGNYFSRAKRTIEDIRSAGQYWGDLYLVAIDFVPNRNFLDFYKVKVKVYNHVDVTQLLEKIKDHPFTGGDGREFTKTAQWNKLLLFDQFWKYWKRIIFFDAGLRIFNKIDYFLSVPYEKSIVALDDSHPEDVKRFGCQLELSNKKIIGELIQKYGNILEERYFLNCCWICDTQIIEKNTLSDLLDLINRYPVCRTNEMGIMNIYFTFEKKIWKSLEINLGNDLILLDWSERDNKNWRNYVALKYPRSINFECL